jgi:hypothetical protein
MSDTLISDSTPHNVAELGMLCRSLERELTASNELIVRLQAVTNDPHALWVNWLRGTVSLPAGIGDVRQYQDRIKRLEEELERTKQDRNAIAKKTREPLLLKLDHAAERIKRLESENDALRADLLLWENGGPLP